MSKKLLSALQDSATNDILRCGESLDKSFTKRSRGAMVKEIMAIASTRTEAEIEQMVSVLHEGSLEGYDELARFIIEGR